MCAALRTLIQSRSWWNLNQMQDTALFSRVSNCPPPSRPQRLTQTDRPLPTPRRSCRPGNNWQGECDGERHIPTQDPASLTIRQLEWEAAAVYDDTVLECGS